MITFDALVGNNDRHFYNWGVIVPTKKALEKPWFAPIYDSARGLLWNLNEEGILKYKRGFQSNGKQFANYLNNSCPRISTEANSNINHFELIRFLKVIENGKYKNTIAQLCTVEKENMVLNMLNIEFIPMFSKVRSEMVLKIMHERFKKVREL